MHADMLRRRNLDLMKLNRNILSDIPPGWLNILLFAVGVAVVLAGALVDSPTDIWKQVLLGVGCSIIASAVVAYLTSHYLRAQNELVRLVDSWRLDGLYRTRAEANQRTNELLVKTKHLDIIAFGLRGFRDRHSGMLESLVKSGLRLRILTLDPDSEFVTARSKSENLINGQLAKDIRDLITWVHHLTSLSSDRTAIEIRTYDALNLDFYWRMDDIVFVGPYVHGETSQQTVTYSFTRGGIGFEYWQSNFERLWNDNTFCQRAKQEASNEKK